MQYCVIVIPIHNPFPTTNELISFKQCFKILNHHTITVLAPDNLNLDKYKEIVPEFEVIFIDPVWQSSLQQYNKLKISSFFYDLFKKYDYLLTYELDAFVFKDELKYWCGKGYDFIGAPWFEGYPSGKSTTIIGIGNGGFSLRNIQCSIHMLNRIHSLKKIRMFWFKSRLQALWPFYNMVLLFNHYFHIRKPNGSNELNSLLLLKHSIHEDRYWANVASIFTDYKIAFVEDAVKFSFEVQPGFLYKKNNDQLPFGCHGWEKYEPEFWKPFINGAKQKEIKDF